MAVSADQYHEHSPTLGVWTTDGFFDATDVLRLFGDVNRSDPAGADLLAGLLAPAGGAYALQEKRSLLGSIDLSSSSDTGDVACQGSLNTEAMIAVGTAAAAAVAKKWLVSLPVDADDRPWDSSGQQYHQRQQGAWESAAEWILMARLVAAHSGDLALFSSAPDRVLCYEAGDGTLVNPGVGPTSGGPALCTTPTRDFSGALGADVFAEAVTAPPFKTRDTPRLQIAGAKRLVQRFSTMGQHNITALHLPLAAVLHPPVRPVTVCMKDVATGAIVYNITVQFNSSELDPASTGGSPIPTGWLRLPLAAPVLPGVYDVAVTAATGPEPIHHHGEELGVASWPTRIKVQGGGSRLESWGYHHADTGPPGSGHSSDDNSCCAQTGSGNALNSTLAHMLGHAMRWQLGLARSQYNRFGMLAVPDSYYNGVPVTGQGTCSASSMWDQIRMGWKATYINMLFLQSIDAWIELEQAGAVQPLAQMDGVTADSALVRQQVAADIDRQLSYDVHQHQQGFYSWVSCNKADETLGVSICDRDSLDGEGQVPVDAQMLPDQAYAVMLGVGNQSAVRARLDGMIEQSVQAQLTGGGLVANNLDNVASDASRKQFVVCMSPATPVYQLAPSLRKCPVPLESIDPRTISSADKWSPTTSDHFCDPSANGTMVYSGHCACRNNSAVGGTVCWGNFGFNQQNGGRVFATQATVFRAGPYQTSFDDFVSLVTTLRAAAAQLHANNYTSPLLGNISGGREMLRSVTFGLRTGPKNALIGFAMGQLRLHVTADGSLTLHGQRVALPGPPPTAPTRVAVTLDPEDSKRWPKDVLGLNFGGLSIGAEGKFRIACNLTSAIALDCEVSVFAA
eukprot:gene10755-1954_t